MKIWNLAQRAIALAALLMAAPLLLLLCPAVRLTSSGPFLYRQWRPGRDGVLFRAIKIRTMVQGADKNSALARSVRSSNPLVTPIGRYLRDMKLDELPQLWNVVRGEMALVGPRPIAPTLQRELEECIPGFRQRLSVKPGVTSLAQVCVLESDEQERVVDDWRVRFEGERHYIENRSFVYDVTIITLTVLYVLRKLGRKLGRRALLLALIPLGMLSLALAGCSERLDTATFVKEGSVLARPIAPGPPPGAHPAAVQVQDIRVPELKRKAADMEYRLGAGDELLINVFGEQGLTEVRTRVDGQGYVQLPVIELINVRNLGTRQIQARLKEAYGKIFVNPWVTVQIARYRSKPVYLLGEFSKPGVVYLEGPTTLVEAVSQGAGLTANAYLPGAMVVRGGKVLPVDVHGLIKSGRTENNIPVEANDSIHVPSIADQKVFILGAVKKPQAVSIGNQALTLARALSQVEGYSQMTARTSQIRVIRTLSPVNGKLILIDLGKILDGLAPDFPLIGGDVVYVPQGPIADWNDIVNSITPTLQLISGFMQPYITIKVLMRD